MMLAALRCEKGEVEQNLREHERVMQEARAAGCALAVFPEMSLSGSVDPARFPEQLLTLDHPAVRAVAALSGELGVGAVFGISECSDTGVAHITQVVAEHGRVVGVQRKRHLGEDEVAYTASDSDAVFDLAGARCAIAICAEGEIERPFAYAASASASVVLFCAAPGLWGRRIDEAAWRRGWEWWRGHGLGDACRHARRTGCGSRWRRRPGRPETRTSPVSPRSSTPRGDPRRAARLASRIAGRRRSALSDLDAALLRSFGRVRRAWGRRARDGDVADAGRAAAGPASTPAIAARDRELTRVGIVPA